jgi:glyoxylase-like metal-dependent hydrolase (beta-lactamase superfamily II)
MALEDEFSDIVKKSRAGQQRSLRDLSRMSGLPELEITALERGEAPRHREQVTALANVLGLRPDALEAIATGSWVPQTVKEQDGLEVVRGSIGGYEVKGYLVHNGGEAVIIDTGYNAHAMLVLLARRRLRLQAICLTHGHTDHAEGIQEILAACSVPVYLGSGDRDLLHWTPPADLLKTPHDGERLKVGSFNLAFMNTPGHTPGGICYRLDGAEQPSCFVGDTLFAGSIGRSNPANLYQTHLESVRTRVLTLPPDTLLFPGHGPATTVREELSHNPFGLPATGE